MVGDQEIVRQLRTMLFYCSHNVSYGTWSNLDVQRTFRFKANELFVHPNSGANCCHAKLADSRNFRGSRWCALTATRRVSATAKGRRGKDHHAIDGPVRTPRIGKGRTAWMKSRMVRRYLASDVFGATPGTKDLIQVKCAHSGIKNHGHKSWPISTGSASLTGS